MEHQIELPFDLELPQARILKAGALTCLYEEGNLRYISLGKTELVRKIYGAVRNDNWTTIPYIIEDETVTINESGFIIAYTAIYNLDQVSYKAVYLIEARADNSISFSMKGIALADFKRNRIGLCLHHPLKECRGKNAVVTRPDGTVYNAGFPELVSATLPFLEMKQFEWKSDEGLTVLLNFEGDVFETEDQRNWSDGSYKTYSSRSSLPMPVAVKTGDTIEQKIIMKVSGSSDIDTTKILFEPGEVKIPFPQIGYSRPVNSLTLTHELISRLIKIPFDHYRVSIKMFQEEWLIQLKQSLDEASSINTRLELEILFSEDYKKEIILLIDQLKEKQLLVKSMLILQKDCNVSPPGLLQYLYPIVKAELPAVMVGYGTNANFVDVNQSRPEEVPFDFISFGVQPQAHAFDNRSILENLQSQPDIMKTAINISGGLPVCIASVTLKDPNAGADQRQYASLVTFWTLICLQNFSEAYSITFYDTTGAAGILNEPSPTYEAFVTIFDFQPVWIVKRFKGEELLMDGLLLENEQGERLFFKGPDEYVF